MTTRPQPHVVGAHAKKIGAATRKLERYEALAASARRDRDDAIRAALADRVTRTQIAKPANMTPDRVKQIGKKPA